MIGTKMRTPVKKRLSSNLTYLSVLLFAAATACTAPTEPTGPAPSAAILAAATVASYRSTITINKDQVPNTDQRNFPVLISGTYAGPAGTLDLRTVGNGGRVQSPSGYDVGFYTNSNCSSGKMKWETEKYTAATGEVAYWVLLPTVSHTINTVFYLCYGNAGITSNQAQPSSVWDSNYLTVWHLADKGGLDLSNSADTRYALTNSGQVSSAPGQIGGGTTKFLFRDSTVDATGTHYSYDYLDNRQVSIAKNGAVTVSMWKNHSSADHTASDGNRISFSMGASHDALNSMILWAPYFNSGAFWWYAGDGPGGYEPPGFIDYSTYFDRWVYITVIYNPSASRLKAIYLDGNLVGSTTNGYTTNGPTTGFRLGQAFEIGSPYGHGNDNSQFDEVRISKSARSADWIRTEFNNQSNPGSFAAAGPEVIR